MNDLADASTGPAGGSRLRLLLLAAGNLGLQLAAVKLIKQTSLMPPTHYVAIAAMTVLILALAFGRFLFWGAMHKRYPLSLSYPVNALIFPMVVLMAWTYDEPVSTAQAVGAVLVTAGVFLALWSSPSEEPGP